MYDRAAELQRRRQLEETLAAYDQLISRFGDATDPEIRERVASAVWYRAEFLERLSREGEADAAGSRLIERDVQSRASIPTETVDATKERLRLRAAAPPLVERRRTTDPIQGDPNPVP